MVSCFYKHTLFQGCEKMIKVVDMGYQFVNVGGFEADRPEGSGDYLFLYLRCPTEVCLEGEYKWHPAGTYVIFEKGAPQIYRKRDAHFINDWIHFDFDCYDEYFERLGVPLNTPLTLQNNAEIIEMTSSLLIEYFSSSTDHETVMAEKADELFCKFAELYHFSNNYSTKMNNYRAAFTDLRHKILNRQYCPDNLDETARRMNLSVSYFQHLYKGFFGNSIHKDIIRARIEQAAQLLKNTDRSISEIARLCGYDNVEHFSRSFKKYKGSSPRNYRKEEA